MKDMEKPVNAMAPHADYVFAVRKLKRKVVSAVSATTRTDIVLLEMQTAKMWFDRSLHEGA